VCDQSPDPSTLGTLAPYEAVLLVSFGGPEQPEEVIPFLERVTRGRGIPRERLAEVGEHYLLFGGRSPINDQCRRLLAALGEELATRGLAAPLFWGNRNSPPFLDEAVRAIEAAGLRRVLAVVTSAYPSYSSCRQYRENLYDAASGTAVQIDRIRHYADHPGFVAAAVDATSAALRRLGAAAEGARLVFVTHSIPVSMAVTAGPEPRTSSGAYVDWHAAVAAEVARQISGGLGRRLDHDLVYCSRSGPDSQSWLEPDVNDHLRALHQQGLRAVVLVPIGFVSDHMEVIFDLDTEAAATAAELGLACERAATAGVHPAFVAGLVDLMLERAAVARGADPDRPVAGSGPVGWYECSPGCCPNLRDPNRPALLQAPV
jgi:protoporphyrin/coproporphyrin ferrochelatase